MEEHIAAARKLVSKLNDRHVAQFGAPSWLTQAKWISGDTKKGMVHVLADDTAWTMTASFIRGK